MNRIKNILKNNAIARFIIRKRNLIHNTINISKGFKGQINKDIIGKNNIISIGENCNCNNLKIYIRGNNNKIKIGNNCYFGPLNSIWAEGENNQIEIGDKCTFTLRNHLNAQENNTRILIGEDCMISNNVIIRTSDSHPIYDLNTRQRINPAQDVVIGNHVWIAPNVKVMKGSIIADGCVVGSDTTINKEYLQKNTLIVGRPAKVIRENIDWSRERLF